MEKNMIYLESDEIPKPLGCKIPLTGEPIYHKAIQTIEKEQLKKFYYIHPTNNELEKYCPVYGPMAKKRQ